MKHFSSSDRKPDCDYSAPHSQFGTAHSDDSIIQMETGGTGFKEGGREY